MNAAFISSISIPYKTSELIVTAEYATNRYRALKI